MSVQVSIQNVDSLDNVIFVSGLLILTGNYVAGGDTVDFTKAVQDPLFSGLLPNIPSSQPPQCFDAWSESGNIANGYFAIVGTQQNNCKIKIVSAFNTELGAGAYPAAILADKIAFQCTFPKFQ